MTRDIRGGVLAFISLVVIVGLFALCCGCTTAQQDLSAAAIRDVLAIAQQIATNRPAQVVTNDAASVSNAPVVTPEAPAVTNAAPVVTNAAAGRVDGFTPSGDWPRKSEITATLTGARNNGHSDLSWTDDRGAWQTKTLSNGKIASGYIWIVVVRDGKQIALRCLDKVGTGDHKGQGNIWGASDASNPFIQADNRPRAGDQFALMVSSIAGKSQRTTWSALTPWR